MNKTNAIRMAATVAALAIITAACGGGDAVTTTAGGAAPVTAAPQGEGVKVGVLVPLTGEEGAFGVIVADAVDLAVKTINATGLNPCGAISLVIADTKTNPQEGIRQGNRLIETENVVAIVGPTSETMVALVDAAETSETVLVSPYAGTISLNDLGGNFVYRTVASDLDDGKAAGLWLAGKGYQSVAVMTLNQESTISIGTAAADVAEEKGIELVANIVFNPGQPSYQAELSQVLNANPDAIFLAAGQQSGVTILKEADQLGYQGDWMLAADMAVPEVIEGAGAEILEGRTFAELASADTALPTYQNFATFFQQEMGEEPGPFAANSWDMMNLIALAMVKSGGCTGAAINDALRDVSSGGTKVSSFEEGARALAGGEDIDYDGASGPVDIDATGSVAGSYSILQVQGGEWTEAQFYSAEELQR
jgi:ABC-type branched-subunit amino acid transport system substrate-binding protein